MTKSKYIYIFLFDGYADWEIAYLTPEMGRNKGYTIQTFSFDGKPVRSMGNLLVTPDCALDAVDLAQTALLVLPGGEAWEAGSLVGILKLVEPLRKQKIPLAAICGATLFLGIHGYLNTVKHTSNNKEYLKRIAPSYTGEAFYQEAEACTDDRLITASGIAPIDFTKEILLCLHAYDTDHIEKWYNLFKNGIWTA